MISEDDDRFLHEAFAMLRRYVAESPEHPVARPRRAQSVGAALPSLSRAGISYDELAGELTEILDQSVRTAHPLFLNSLQAGFDPVSWLGEIAAALLNPTMATFEVAPVLTVIEQRMGSELLALFGLGGGQAIMTTGGSNANLLALLCARSDLDRELRVRGLPHNRFRIYVSEAAHYSFDKAANITGIGTGNVVLVPCNARDEMIVDELERCIARDIGDGYTPVMVGATAGTTVLGAFDPIDAIADVCAARAIWLHVDGAWGGPAIFSPTARPLLRGAERADSIAIDAHKALRTPLIASYFLTRHPDILAATTRSGGGEYLFHLDDPQLDTGTYSLQCGRRADALKLWLVWRHLGSDGVGAHVDALLALARLAAAEVEQRPRLELVCSHYLNVCFRVRTADPDGDSDGLTLRVRQELVEDGRALVNYAARRDGTNCFRLVFGNHHTRLAHVTWLLDEICAIADRLDPAVPAERLARARTGAHSR